MVPAKRWGPRQEGAGSGSGAGAPALGTGFGRGAGGTSQRNAPFGLCQSCVRATSCHFETGHRDSGPKSSASCTPPLPRAEIVLRASFPRSGLSWRRGGSREAEAVSRPFPGGLSLFHPAHKWGKQKALFFLKLGCLGCNSRFSMAV